MFIEKISDIQLFIFYDDKGRESYDIGTWLSNNHVEFSTITYHDKESSETNIQALNTWISNDPSEDNIEGGCVLFYKQLQEDKKIIIQTDEQGNPLYDEDHQGNIIIKYNVETIINNKQKTIRSAEQLENSNFLENYLLTDG